MTTNDNKQKLSAWLLAASLATALCGCSGEITDGNTLPDGKYPMTFTAQVDGLNATRATGKDTWVEGDEIAVSIDGGSDSKTYKITDISTGAMSPDDADNTLYWQKNRGQRIQAWFPVSATATATISDQSSGFSRYDYLVSDGTYDYTASGVELPFTHAMAKVKYTLKNGEGISDDDISSAAVQIYGYTEVSFTNGTLSGSTEGWITPHADRKALVVPLQLQRQQFIKVTIGMNGGARDYYYTPTDVNLEAGKQYNYTITVKKTGLAVALTSAPAWGNGGDITGGSEVSSFSVKIPTVPGVTPTIDGTIGNVGEIYTTSSNSFSITLSVSSGSRKSFNVKGGKCDVAVEHTENGSNNKFTYSNIRSDLELVYGDYAEVGDYYYADGTWSPDYTASGSSACIGIVFKSGATQGDVASNYDSKLTDGIHGYVVALTDALTYAGEWGARGTDENNESLPDVSSNTDMKYNGYVQTKYILDTHSADLTHYEAFSAVKNYATAAPNNSSGWYLPSMKQLSDVWQLYKGAAGNVLYDRLNGISSDNLFQTGNTGGNHNKDNQYRYWTSTEKSSTDAWYVVFDTGGTIAAYAKDKGYDRLCRARAILTF